MNITEAMYSLLASDGFKRLKEEEKEYQKELLIRNEIDALRRSCEEAVNSYGICPQSIAGEIMTEPAARELFIQIALRWIRFYASEGENCMDRRNELAVERCRYIASADAFSKFYEKTARTDDVSFAAALFVKKSTEMHHTLMQQFTSVIIYALKIADEGKTNLYDKYRFPLI